MTNSELLREAIRASGYKLGYLAEQLGLTRHGLHKKLNNESEFKASEILTLTKLLSLTPETRDAVFFCPEVDKSSTT
jgi:plasmid maintenance system antidote protein VapI